VLTAYEPLDDDDRSLSLVAGASSGSDHPVSKAIVAGARARDLEIPAADDLEDHPGSGIEATVEGKRIRVGKPGWFGEQDDAARARIDELASGGATVILASVDGAIAGIAVVADEIKAGARESIEAIRKLSITPVMITGDSESAARKIATEAGIEEVRAEVLPEHKEREVRERQGLGATVAMVGDGINDAPALARADVGIAIGTGTDVALQASDVTLVGGDLSAVPRAISLSRRTMGIIRQNLFWAFFYNVILVPVAAGALAAFVVLPDFIRELHPAAAAAAMAFSSITVVLNSLRLGRA
jgi:Cu+-exporting ATPase